MNHTLKRLLFFILLFISSTLLNAQGPFVGTIVSNKGKTAIKAGWAGAVEVAAVYTPEVLSKDESSFLGGSIKIPVWPSKSLNYEGDLFVAFFFTYTGGVIQKPNVASKKSQAFTSTYAFSPELIWFNNKIGLSIPLEVGYGRSHLIQDFRDQYDASSNAYFVKRGFYFSTGLRIYLFNAECPYLKGLKIGY